MKFNKKMNQKEFSFKIRKFKINWKLQKVSFFQRWIKEKLDLRILKNLINKIKQLLKPIICKLYQLKNKTKNYYHQE